MSEPVENAYTNNQCNNGCISRTKLDLLNSILGEVNGTKVDDIKNIVEPIIAGLEKRVIKRVGTGNILQGQIYDKELLEFSDTSERENLKSNLKTLESLLDNKEVIINEFEEKKKKLLDDLKIILVDLNKGITNLSKDKSDKMRIFYEFQKIYNETYQALGANQIQQYELGSFLYKDPIFSKRFTVVKNGKNIDITDTTNNVVYSMVDNGGIQKDEKDYIYFINNHKIGFRRFVLDKDLKISRLSQNDLLDFLPKDLQSLNINATQRKELAAFLNYDTNFRTNYNISANNVGEITFTDANNNEYIMRTDGGIVKMDGSEPVNYIYDISDASSKNIKFREASIMDGTNRLLQNRRSLWGGKTKKRRKNKRKRRKTRRK